MKADFAAFIDELKVNPLQGVDLGGGMRKIRIAIHSKGKGKSGGARIITFNALISEDKTHVLLLTIYDKSERESISDKEINEILSRYY